MSVSAIPLLPVVQMGLVEKVVEDVQNTPLMQQMAAQSTAQKVLAEERSQVQRAEQSSDGKGIDPDRQGRQQENGHQHFQQQQQQEAPEEQPYQGCPWSGKLVNTKV